MVGFVEFAESLNSANLALYCWRGGMRSESMAWLLERYGLETIVLEGGYKAYRNHILKFFDKPLPLKVITGYTGSKKTALLHLLEEQGEQVVDLEGLAQHQGSSFGNKKSIQQPSTEQFQNLMYERIRMMDNNRPIWIEDECIRIGQVNLPENLYRQINVSPHIFIDIPPSQRIDFLLEDYGILSPEELIDATKAIRKKLGFDHASRAIQFIQSGELRRAAEIILTYYDRRYKESIEGKKHLIQEYYKMDMKDLPELAARLSNKKVHAV
jgi:tRNA 2-selenouridine synthase